MMPLEHAIIGYIGYSLFVHIVYRDAPTAGETLVVVFASILPDLIDKPLAWEFGVFASGRALAHSVFFAVPLVCVVLMIAWQRGVPRAGGAFAIGYLLHLPADVIPAYLRDGELPIERIVWPLRAEEPGTPDGFRASLIDNVGGYVAWVLRQATSGNPDPYFFALLGLGGFGFLLWLYDGLPVGSEAYLSSRRTIGRFVGSD